MVVGYILQLSKPLHPCPALAILHSVNDSTCVNNHMIIKMPTKQLRPYQRACCDWPGSSPRHQTASVMAADCLLLSVNMKTTFSVITHHAVDQNSSQQSAVRRWRSSGMQHTASSVVPGVSLCVLQVSAEGIFVWLKLWQMTPTDFLRCHIYRLIWQAKVFMEHSV